MLTACDEDEQGSVLVASVAGRIERVSKLVSVRPPKTRYSGDVGDLVVGRVVAIESKRWKVDIHGWKDAALQLSSVNLPGGVQRIRTYEDQLQMRTLFTENDLISAEIQNIKADGLVSLHTRSLRYGKLENGLLVCVPAALIKRLPQHNVTLPWEIDVLLGKNGMVWISRSISEDWKAKEGLGADVDDSAPLAETLQRLRQRHASTPLTLEQRRNITRVRNVVQCLSIVHRVVEPEAIIALYQRSLDLNLEPKELLYPDKIPKLFSV